MNPTPHPDPAPLRILDITTFYTASSGGVRTYLDAKARFLAAGPHSHSLIVPGPENGESSLHGTRVHRLKGPPIPSTPGYRMLLSGPAIERVLLEERPDVIEVGSPFLVPLLVRWAARHLPGSAVLGFYHTDVVRTWAATYVGGPGSPARAFGVAAARRFARSVYSRFDATLAASRSVVGELAEMGIPRVRLIPFGVDLQLFHPARRTGALGRLAGVDPGVPIGLFAGRLCPEKGLDIVLDAHASIPVPERPHLVLLGEGQSGPGFEARARATERLTVLPFERDRSRLAGLMADADFYLASGPGETFGLAVAEGLASGLPLLAVSSGAVPDRVAGSSAAEEYGEGDVEGCARGMRRLMSRMGPALRSGARAHAERTLDWETTFENLLGVYREALLLRRSHRRGARTRPAA